MTTPMERSASLAVGTIESVAPNEFKVQLDVDAPQTTALNTGSPVAFPRINSYVLVPGQGGAVVGQVTWIGIERSAFPKRKGLKDFGLIDLPFPLRRLAVTPIGTLRVRSKPSGGGELLELERGISLFPSVGDPVSLPTAKQLKAIVETPEEEAPVEIGHSALADNAVIRIHPDHLFGRHLAVLGNTGSGKSCSVAGLIRWTIEAAATNRKAVSGSLPAQPRGGKRGCRFIVLDPNGEYGMAFKQSGAKVRVLTPPEKSCGADSLIVPAWMWNSQEWSAILQAAPGVQEPVLFEALGKLRVGGASPARQSVDRFQAFQQYASVFETLLSDVAAAFVDYAKRMSVLKCINGMKDVLSAIEAQEIEGDEEIRAAAATCRAELGKVKVGDKNNEVIGCDLLEEIRTAIGEVLRRSPKIEGGIVPGPDRPVEFDIDKLPAALHLCARASGDNRISQNIAPLVGRLDVILSNSKLSPIIKPDLAVTLERWLDAMLGERDDTEDSIVVVDLALVPSEVTHLVIAVIARILFEATQRYHRTYGEALPSVLILEEAHTFVQAGRDDPAQSPTPVQMCRRIFERIAREGRKFGMGLVLSSQRPSEISPTVLSQCNTFLLHRLVNDADQNLVRKLVPDALSDLMYELPTLPSRHGILLGHASPIPKLVVINELPAEHRPTSSDPPIWDVWRGAQERKIDWGELTREWAHPGADEPAE